MTTTEPAAWRAVARWYAENERRRSTPLVEAMGMHVPRELRTQCVRRFCDFVGRATLTNRQRSLFCLLMAHEAEEEK